MGIIDTNHLKGSYDRFTQLPAHKVANGDESSIPHSSTAANNKLSDHYFAHLASIINCLVFAIAVAPAVTTAVTTIGILALMTTGIQHQALSVHLTIKTVSL